MPSKPARELEKDGIKPEIIYLRTPAPPQRRGNPRLRPQDRRLVLAGLRKADGKAVAGEIVAR